MTIHVKLFATLRIHLGVATLDVPFNEPPTVAELLDALSQSVGEDVREWLLDDEGAIEKGTMILLDGHNILHMQGLKTKVTADKVSIFPPAGGG